MNRETAKNIAFGLGAVCSMVLIGATLLGVLLTTQTFVTEYSVLTAHPAFAAGR